MKKIDSLIKKYIGDNLLYVINNENDEFIHYVICEFNNGWCAISIIKSAHNITTLYLHVTISFLDVKHKIYSTLHCNNEILMAKIIKNFLVIKTIYEYMKKYTNDISTRIKIKDEFILTFYDAYIEINRQDKILYSEFDIKILNKYLHKPLKYCEIFI